MTGRVTQLSHGRLCGIIRASDGQSVFFHGRDLEGAQLFMAHDQDQYAKMGGKWYK